MRTALAILVLLVVTTAAHGAKSCMSRSEARQIYPRAYLYWSGGPKGQRCWSNRRGRHRGVEARALVPEPLAPRLVKIEPIHEPPRWQQHWHPQWAWVFDTVVNQPKEDELPYSTFAQGEEPDIWPILEAPAANADRILLVAMCGVLALVFGILFQRWHSRRVRITR